MANDPHRILTFCFLAFPDGILYVLAFSDGTLYISAFSDRTLYILAFSDGILYLTFYFRHSQMESFFCLAFSKGIRLSYIHANILLLGILRWNPESPCCSVKKPGIKVFVTKCLSFLIANS